MMEGTVGDVTAPDGTKSTVAAFVILLSMTDQAATVRYYFDSWDYVEVPVQLVARRRTPINVGDHVGARKGSFSAQVHFSDVGFAGLVMRPMSNKFWDTDALHEANVVVTCGG
jgi:hypothetical protein